jgi:hypothetical protein
MNVGDPVTRQSDGSMALSAAGDTISGVIVGIGQYYDSAVGAMRFGRNIPGGTAWGTIFARRSTIYVVPAPMAVFEVDCDVAGQATTEAGYAAFIEENANLSMNPVAGSTTAKPRLAISGHANTNTLGFRIIGISKRVNQDFTGNYVKLLVTPNVIRNAPFQTTGLA